MDDDRRHFLRAAAAALAASPWLGANAQTGVDTPHPHDMSQMPASWTGKEQIGMVMYPGMTALDFVGPQYMFASLLGATVHHVAADMKPVKCDTQISLLPTATFSQVPENLDILFVPGGGAGTITAMQDASLLRFVAEHGRRAKWVTSVCTGSLVLGAAGLLTGYRATSHWVTTPLLAEVGAIADKSRVVRDRNRITGAGVSAGLDLGLTLVGILRDTLYAETVQLLAEYAPQPPYNAGTPRTAPPEAKAMLDDMFKEFNPMARAAIRKSPGGGAS
ncbi:DJ-1/PfpI family protein [Variovorax sp. VNK109]|uniref:DJ-1/PfpI family protein n=1 Tax=Variovorax sp. VNK109 TaxID=3400919 RepID=UPI003C064DDF